MYTDNHMMGSWMRQIHGIVDGHQTQRHLPGATEAFGEHAEKRPITLGEPGLGRF